MPYLVKARMTKWVKFAVLGISDWTRVGKGIEVAEARVKLLGWSRERRLVVIRQEVATKETKALGKKLLDNKKPPGIQGLRGNCKIREGG